MKVGFMHVSWKAGPDVFTRNLSMGLEKKEIDTSINFFPWFLEAFPHPLKYVVKDSDLDIIHSNTTGGFIFKKDGIPLVVTEHQTFVFDKAFIGYRNFLQKHYHGLISEYIKKTLYSADKVLCVSDYVKKVIEEVYEFYECDRVYNGVDKDLFKPMKIDRKNYRISENKKILLFAGNPTKKKGVDLLPKIMKELGDDYILYCASGIRKDIKKRDGKNIVWIGTLDQAKMVEYYNLCDIYLHPSRTESFSLTVAEAMACGRPVVCTDCTALPELVTDGKGGFLCGIDDVRDFAENIRTLAEDDSLRKEMGEFNRRRAIKEFSIDRMVDGYFKIYKKLYR